MLGGKSLAEIALVPAGTLPSTRAATQDLVYGALRRYGLGDALLGPLLQKPLPMPEIRALLLCALYRLQTRPDAAHTIVDQAVEAAATFAHGAFRGLVNGVLRNFLRQRESLEQGLSGAATTWHPDWWVQKLRRTFPKDWPGIIAAGNALPPMSLRVNRRRQTRDVCLEAFARAGIEAVARGEDGLRLACPQPVDILPGFADGCVSVQDLGAQRAAELLDAAPGMRVLDACAAPGGKAAHLLERSNLELMALDLDPGRARRIDENLARLSLKAAVKVADCREVKKWWDGKAFDRVLADVPCTASGVVRRHPDSKWLRRESDIRKFARTQFEILDALWPTLAPGGKLLYATCSVFPEENGGQIDAFLVRAPEATELHREQLLPNDDHDGFFYALLQKTR